MRIAKKNEMKVTLTIIVKAIKEAALVSLRPILITKINSM